MTARIIQGDCFDVLPTLAAGSVDCVVTSPPYWMLRDYGTGTWEGGNDPACDHKQGRQTGRLAASPKQQTNGAGDVTTWPVCGKCGARRIDKQLGMEPTVGEYVARMVEVFRLVRRAMSPHATCWVNIGDSYVSGPTGPRVNPGNLNGAPNSVSTKQGMGDKAGAGIPDGNLCLIPQRLAIALQDDGWLVRSIVVWHKPAPMPGSMAGWRWVRCRVKVKAGARPKTGGPAVGANGWQSVATGHSRPGGGGGENLATSPVGRPEWAPCPGCDKCIPNGGLVLRRGKWRPTSSWEPVLLLAKGPGYYADGEAVRTPGQARIVTDTPIRRQFADGTRGRREGGGDDGLGCDPSGANLRDVWRADMSKRDMLTELEKLSEEELKSLLFPSDGNPPDFLSIASEPLKQKHYACVDAETECLTVAGWKSHDELSVGDTVAQYNREAERLSWAPLAAVTRYNVTNEQLLYFRRRGFNWLVTKNHRCLVRRRTNNQYVSEVVEAGAVRSCHQIPVSAEWEDGGDDSLPVELCELLGWYVAEGHECKNGTAVDIYQSDTANPEKVARIRSLLESLKAEWRVAFGKRVWRGRDTVSAAFRVFGYDALRIRELCPNKQPPADCLRWTKDRAAAFLKGFIGGDGHVRAKDSRMSFSQKRTDIADAVQALLARCGYCSTMRRELVDDYPIWQVTISEYRWRDSRTRNGAFTPPVPMPYSGVVWCPTVPSGFWLARRRGQVFITGNSFPSELVYRCLAAGTSARGYCPACSAPWARVMETPAIGCTRHRRNDHDRSLTGASRPRPTAEIAEALAQYKTLGWRPTCPHGDLPPRPGRVLDPFAGSFRTGLSAQRLGLDFVGIELSEAYCQIGKRLLTEESPLFCEVEE